jgi:hypothetical protein
MWDSGRRPHLPPPDLPTWNLCPVLLVIGENGGLEDDASLDNGA